MAKQSSKTDISTTINFQNDAGAGMEGADKASFAIPFITVLQGLSPQIETVEGAKPGLFINTITNELFKEAKVVPCAYQRRYLRWAPREEGGGYKGEYLPQDVETGKLDVDTNERGQPTLEGDLLKDTRNHFVLVQNSVGVWKPALISLSSTQIKKSKRWMSLISGIEMQDSNGKTFNPPSFSHIYTIRPVKEENSQGSWWGVEISIDSQIEDADLYRRARDFHASVTAGEVEVAPPVEEPPAKEDF